MSSLLALENLQTTFRTREGEVHAVRGVSFQVQPGGTCRHRRRVGLREKRHL